MTTTRYIILIVLVTFALLLAGCRLSASTPPPVTETPDSAMNTLEAELQVIGTQTAIAGGGEETAPTEPSPADATPTTSTDATQPTSPEATEPPPPPSPTPAPVFTATPGIPETYQLQKGEFPYCIARRFNVNQTEILNVNGLGAGAVVPVGYNLKIPQTGNPFSGQRALKNHPTNYTVVSGDTIYTIACQFGDVDPNAIIQANSLQSPYDLSSGQVLHIP